MEQIHSFCLVEGTPDGGYPTLYDKISEYTSQNYAVIYAAETGTTQTVQRMSQHGIDVETLVESGMLTIVDRNTVYAPSETRQLDSHAVLNSWHCMILKVKRKAQVSGILAIGSAEKFLEKASWHRKLVAYEQVVGKSFQIPIEAICCYDVKSISKLSLHDLIAVLNAHHSIIHRGCRYAEWTPMRITELMHMGLDKILGFELSNLIFKTMKLVYKVDDNKIMSNPKVFEDILTRIIGEHSARQTLNQIMAEIRKHIAF